MSEIKNGRLGLDRKRCNNLRSWALKGAWESIVFGNNMVYMGDDAHYLCWQLSFLFGLSYDVSLKFVARLS